MNGLLVGLDVGTALLKRTADFFLLFATKWGHVRKLKVTHLFGVSALLSSKWTILFRGFLSYFFLFG